MRRDYIPEKDAEFDKWLKNFTAFIEAHYAEFGLSAAEKDALVAAANVWNTGYPAHLTAKGVARGAKEKKNQNRKSYESIARKLTQRVTVHPAATDAHRASAGITVPDTKPTPTAPEYVATLDPPLLLLDWSRRGVVLVHFGVNPANEKENAKPKDIAGAKIWFRIGTDSLRSLQAGAWQFLVDDTNSPYYHNLNITEPASVEYRAQWFDHKMRTGPFGQTAKCTVTP